ncbi:MAG: hypothetical protein ACTHOJ_09215 [Sphingomonas oligoaromativorans]|jgi:hypothetical protein|uniref:hypothetical protein n=1 Tax=Sphingomonas oligoaromativorans TaxID=575322 RepID=UPI001423B809|nr:hypothetical protein [Sphingomonas oligoaromativorans]NIJ32007.1 hypothetical protein [Sphingomonas oligoaromativorans]
MRFVIMDNERFNKALGRIEAAIERLEQAGPAAPSAAVDTRLAELEARHQRLRDGTSDALARLDRLIDSASSAPKGG